MSIPAFLLYFSHANVCILLPADDKMGKFEGVSTQRFVLRYQMLLWLNHFISILYSLIFSNIFNISNIRLDFPERKVVPKRFIKMYTKLYLTPIHQMVST